MDKETNAREPLRGRLTDVGLTDTEDFFTTPLVDAWDVERRPFSKTSAQLSAELAASGYDLNIAPWINAGWDDCTFVVEDRVLLLDRADDSRMSNLESEWKRRRARALIRGSNPINDLMRAIRQLLVTDMGKCIVMTRPQPDGRALVAISFIGTTDKYFDWFSNFKFQQDAGMHHGFVELARRFDMQAPRVLLPKLAAALGEETFTLADAILEAKKPDSRITFWMCGHSQGGALVQTYTHLLQEQGVHLQHLQGYTFAAPTVAAADGSVDPKVYPIYNIVSTDDVVPRVGSQVRLGVDCVYQPDRAFRKIHYRVKEEQEKAFSRALFISAQVQTMPEAFCWFIALFRMMREMEADGALEMMFSRLLPHLSLLRRMKLSAAEVAEYLETKLTGYMEDLTGGTMDDTMCMHYEASMRVMLDEFGAKDTADALLSSIVEPHVMRPDPKDEEHVTPYLGIVRFHLDECTQGVWMSDEPPRCLDANGERLIPSRHHGTLLLLSEDITMALPEPESQDESTQKEDAGKEG